MTVVCTSDEKYLPLFNAFAQSALDNSPSTKIICRCVDVDKSVLVKFNNVKYIFDTIKLNKKPTIVKPDWRAKRYTTDRPLRDLHPKVNDYQILKRIYSEHAAYCTGIKYDTLNTLMVDEIDEVYIYSDVDAIIRKDIHDLHDIMYKYDADIGVVTDVMVEYNSTNFNCFDKAKLIRDFELETGGLIVVRNTEKSRKFIKFCAEEIDIFNVSSDELVFNDACKLFEPVTVKIPLKYKDEGGPDNRDFREDSCIWSGQGDIKNFSPTYTKELNYYLNRVKSIL